MTDVPRYTVYLKPAAERALGKIADRTARRRITRAIDGLATDRTAAPSREDSGFRRAVAHPRR